MKKYINAKPEQFLNFAQKEVEGPFVMLNLLKFKDKVEETGKTGEEEYLNYMKEAQPFFEKSGGQIVYYGKAVSTIIGPAGGEEWDKVLLIKYDKKESFAEMVTAKDYPSKLRTRALEDSRLICCK